MATKTKLSILIFLVVLGIILYVVGYEAIGSLLCILSMFFIPIKKAKDNSYYSNDYDDSDGDSDSD